MTDNGIFARRNPAIDMLRALTMFLMMTVNEFWTVHNVPHWMLHAVSGEDMLGLSDIVFPLFLFAMGMSIPYAIEARYRKGYSGESTMLHILSRGATLLVMGMFTNNGGSFAPDLWYGRAGWWILMVIGFFLLWNSYPKTEDVNRKRLFCALKTLGAAILVYLAVTCRGPEGQLFRTSWWGILGLIGWTYMFCAIVYLFCRNNLGKICAWAVAFLVINVIVTPMRSGTAIFHPGSANAFDSIRNLLGVNNAAQHLLATSGMILSIVSARMADQRSSKRLGLALGAGALCLVAGLLTHRLWIVSKLSATLPWVLFVCAIGISAYGILKWLADRDITAWFTPFKPAGTATLTAYMIPYLAVAIWIIFDMSAPEWLSGWIGVAKCVLYTFVCIGVTWCLGKLGIKLKI